MQAGDVGTVVSTNLSMLGIGSLGYVVYGKLVRYESNTTFGSTAFLIQVCVVYVAVRLRSILRPLR